MQDKVAVVTGASRGLGAGLVRGFHRAGLFVAGCARSRPAPGLVPDDPERVWFAEVDVTDAEAVADFAGAVHGRFGAPDLWVNNAGVVDPIGPLRSVDPDAFAAHVAVNLGGVLHGMRAAFRAWRAAGTTGTVVNISSGAANAPYEGWGPYCATKAAVDMLTRVAAREEAASGYRVHALAPGVVDTDMQALIRAQDPDDFPALERFLRLHAEGELADPESPVPALLRIAFGPRVDSVVLDVRRSPELQ